MKNSIATLLNSYVHDNSDSIKENGGNVAEYILRDAEAQEFGWFWFLTDDEIEEFENNPTRREEMIKEIQVYVNSNYDYELE